MFLQIAPMILLSILIMWPRDDEAKEREKQKKKQSHRTVVLWNGLLKIKKISKKFGSRMAFYCFHAEFIVSS